MSCGTASVRISRSSGVDRVDVRERRVRRTEVDADDVAAVCGRVLRGAHPSSPDLDLGGHQHGRIGSRRSASAGSPSPRATRRGAGFHGTAAHLQVDPSRESGLVRSRPAPPPRRRPRRKGSAPASDARRPPCEALRGSRVPLRRLADRCSRRGPRARSRPASLPPEACRGASGLRPWKRPPARPSSPPPASEPPQSHLVRATAKRAR